MSFYKHGKLNLVLFSTVLVTILLYFSCQVQAATPTVILDDKTLSFDVNPIIENGRVLVPLRAIFEEMGAEVSWDATTMTATAVKGDTTVILTIGSLEPKINGNTKPIDTAGKIVNGRTLAPLRFVCEAFGGSVDWEADSQTAIIRSSKDSTEPDSNSNISTPEAPSSTNTSSSKDPLYSEASLELQQIYDAIEGSTFSKKKDLKYPELIFSKNCSVQFHEKDNMILIFQMSRSDNSADEDIKKALQVFFPNDFQKAFNDYSSTINGNKKYSDWEPLGDKQIRCDSMGSNSFVIGIQL
jgi:hypothetical protein